MGTLFIEPVFNDEVNGCCMGWVHRPRAPQGPCVIESIPYDKTTCQKNYQEIIISDSYQETIKTPIRLL